MNLALEDLLVTGKATWHPQQLSLANPTIQAEHSCNTMISHLHLIHQDIIVHFTSYYIRRTYCGIYS